MNHNKFNFKNEEPTNIMIDLETTGLRPGCRILAIGATTFLHKGEAKQFFMSIDPDQYKYRLVDDKSTMDWWNSQDKRLKDEIFGGTQDLFQVLTYFSSWLSSITKQPVVWGNAASFDLKILEAAYKAIDLPVPWKYNNEMCFRTLKTLYKGMVPEPKFIGEKHNLLHDAVHQANWAQEIYAHQAGLYQAIEYAKQFVPAELGEGNES